MGAAVERGGRMLSSGAAVTRGCYHRGTETARPMWDKPWAPRWSVAEGCYLLTLPRREVAILARVKFVKRGIRSKSAASARASHHKDSCQTATARARAVSAP